MSSLCQITPISAFQNTNLNSHIECIQGLGARILRMLGHPMINVELHPDQLYDAISMSCEFFTKYAGYTKEYLIFDSRLYEPHKGLRLDHLYTVANTGFTLSQKLAETNKPSPDTNIDLRGNLFISLSDIPKSYFISSSALSAAVSDEGITKMQILDQTTYSTLTSFDSSLNSLFLISPQKSFNISCETQENVTQINNMFDYDIMDYRKVIDVVDFEEGSSNGFTSLFTQESFLAQQVYNSAIGIGNYGFDLLSWHVTKDWIDTREKILALKRDISFDSRTQYLKMYPQPRATTPFYGLLECYVERSFRDIVKEKFVLDYAVALSKIMWGRVLTHIKGVTLIGGGILDGAEILAEGTAEKERLETFLIEGGFGDYAPLGMFIG